MPRKSDLIPIKNEKLDRRVKLTAKQKEEIAEKYATGLHSYRTLSEEYGVSKRTISFIIKPDSLEENKMRRAERGGSMAYYDKDVHREAMQNHRLYKKELYAQNKIGNIEK